MEKNMVKYSHCRIAETMFEALSLVYLKDWVTLFISLSSSNSRRKINEEVWSPVGSQCEQVVRTIYKLPDREFIPLKKLHCISWVVHSRNVICHGILFGANPSKDWCKTSCADNEQELSQKLLHLEILGSFMGEYIYDSIVV